MLFGISSETCSVYTVKQENKMDIQHDNGYHEQIQIKIQQLPNMKPTTHWNWFKDTKYYTQRTFNKNWNQIKKEHDNSNKPTTNKTRTAPPTNPEHEANFANKSAELLFKYVYCMIIIWIY